MTLTVSKKHLVALLTALLAVPLMSQSQSQIVAKDPSGNIVEVKVDSSGNLVTATGSAPTGAASGTHGACTHNTFNVGTTGTNCPPVALANRKTLLIQLVQPGQLLTVVSDGVTAATATVGIQIGSGATLSDNLAGNVNASCRCDAATCSVRTEECP